MISSLFRSTKLPYPLWISNRSWSTSSLTSLPSRSPALTPHSRLFHPHPPCPRYEAIQAKRQFWSKISSLNSLNSQPIPNQPEQPQQLSYVDSIRRDASSVDPFQLVAHDLRDMMTAIKETVSIYSNPLLNKASQHFLHKQGKQFRPILVLLMAHACSPALLATTYVQTPPQHNSSCSHAFSQQDQPILPSQKKLAEITELIHTASLLHDDVIDVSDTRRGAPSVNATFGNQLAVLAGDFLLARASIALARLRNCDVVETISTVIEHLVQGEIIQMDSNSLLKINSHITAHLQAYIWDSFATQTENLQYDTINWSILLNELSHDAPLHDFRKLMTTYLEKTFFKTASLMAHSCKGVTMLAAAPDNISDAAYKFGESIGIAFQLVDDALDMSSSSSILGKPALADLKAGVVTAPVLFALLHEPELVLPAIHRRFSRQDDIQAIGDAVLRANGVEKTLLFAKKILESGILCLVRDLPESDHRNALINLGTHVLERKK